VLAPTTPNKKQTARPHRQAARTTPHEIAAGRHILDAAKVSAEAPTLRNFRATCLSKTQPRKRRHPLAVGVSHGQTTLQPAFARDVSFEPEAVCVMPAIFDCAKRRENDNILNA
jgi:hypothetical protein